MAPPSPPHRPAGVAHQVPLSGALDGSETLASLLRRVRESQARLDHVAPLLPAALRATVTAGPLDDERWTLLVANASTAAKIRQWGPALEQALSEAGWPARRLRVKITAAR